MAKKVKKNIKDFKQALLSNTDFIKDETPVESNIEPTPSLIDEEILNKLEILAEFENVQLYEMVNKALNHFLRLKGMQLEQAIKAKQSKQ